MIVTKLQTRAMLTSLISLNCCGQYFVSVYLFDSFLVFMLQAALEYFFFI